ncbi:uncharacterized protein LOC143355412 [Halictus rubicundus]|uniref:uncharacterized protein LOC143355412 n=1 Tax=Halictus rubicundus TaxID=77578 RepID=UPI00403743B1
MLAKKDDCEIKRKSLQKEAEWFELCLKLANKIRSLRESNLYDAHYKAKKKCLDQLRKYDETIRTLYANKTTLLRDRDNLDKDCATVQNKLSKQLTLYNRLKEEREQNAMHDFLEKVERFRLNHAAKIIQRNWRLYCTRVSSKKKKSRK